MREEMEIKRRRRDWPWLWGMLRWGYPPGWVAGRGDLGRPKVWRKLIRYADPLEEVRRRIRLQPEVEPLGDIADDDDVLQIFGGDLDLPPEPMLATTHVAKVDSFISPKARSLSRTSDKPPQLPVNEHQAPPPPSLHPIPPPLPPPDSSPPKTSDNPLRRPVNGDYDPAPLPGHSPSPPPPPPDFLPKLQKIPNNPSRRPASRDNELPPRPGHPPSPLAPPRNSRPPKTPNNLSRLPVNGDHDHPSPSGHPPSPPPPPPPPSPSSPPAFPHPLPPPALQPSWRALPASSPRIPTPVRRWVSYDAELFASDRLMVYTAARPLPLGF